MSLNNKTTKKQRHSKLHFICIVHGTAVGVQTNKITLKKYTGSRSKNSKMLDFNNFFLKAQISIKFKHTLNTHTMYKVSLKSSKYFIQNCREERLGLSLNIYVTTVDIL